MDKKRKFLFTIIIGLAGLFLLTTKFYLPMAKDNAKRLAEYKQLKQQVQIAGKLSRNELNVMEEKLDTAISNLEQRFPPEGRLKLVEQITRVPKDVKISFTEITHREPRQDKDYEAFPVDVNMKAQFYDLIKYLAEIKTNPLMISVDGLSIEKVETQTKTLDIRATFSGFRLTHQFPSPSHYVEKRYTAFEKQYLEKLLKPVKPAESSKKIVLSSEDYDPFSVTRDLKESQEKGFPAPQLFGIDGLSLKGILRIGEKKAALINDTVVKEGENIDGMKVLEIQDYQVVLTQSGKRYILKTGEDDEFLKP